MSAWKPMKCFDIQIKRRLDEIYFLSVSTSSWFANYFVLSSFTIVTVWLLADGDDCNDVFGRVSAWSLTPANIIIYSQWAGIKQTNFSFILSKLSALMLCSNSTEIEDDRVNCKTKMIVVRRYILENNCLKHYSNQFG